MKLFSMEDNRESFGILPVGTALYISFLDARTCAYGTSGQGPFGLPDAWHPHMAHEACMIGLHGRHT
ncbi:MAG: hypothetical protein ABI477_14315, partial [Chryseolinea sp.]